MSHLPECAERRAEWRWSEDCICDDLLRAYRRGLADVDADAVRQNDAYQRGYTAGYNDHARSRVHAEEMYGPYLSKVAAERLALYDRPDAVFNQHGKGENP